MMASDSTVIRTLRIKTALPDRLAARLQTERALQASSLRPIGLPRDAILIVRQIKSRRAGSAGWEQAVNAQLDQLARQAARPIEGAVLANAEAVIFTDRSELLTCLAADWCAGVVRTQWWWQSLLHNGDVARVVIDAWLAAPEVIPLALQRLSARQQTIVFVQRLSDTHTRSILRALVQTFGLYELSLTLAEIGAMESNSRDVIATPPATALPAPPWQPWVQTRTEHLSIDRQVLLAVGLMLTAAPNIVRAASFASEVKTWHAAIHTMPRPAAPDVPTPVSPSVPASSTTAESTTTPQSPGKFGTFVAQPDESISAEPSWRGGRRPTKQSLPEQRSDLAAHEHVPQQAIDKAELHLADSLTPTAIAQPQFDIDTEFGGICYFINLGIFLNLYGDFTTPLQPGLDLPIWDFVALVAHDLLGDDVTRDPIWALLARLADRDEDEPPGENFDSPDVIGVALAGQVIQSTNRRCLTSRLARRHQIGSPI